MSLEKKANHPRFLVMMPMGIGDAVAIGLSAVDQIIKNEPAAHGAIDIVCNDLQADIFRHDPRIHNIICVDSSIFSTPDVRTWVKGILLPPEAMKLVHVLHNRHYEAAFPGNTTPIFYNRLQTRIMRISVLKLFRDFLSLRHLADIPMGKITRQIVNAYFGNKLPEPAIDEAIPLYMTSQHISEARTAVERLKELSGVPGKHCQLLMIAADTASIVTRPPTNLLAAGIGAALAKKPQLVVSILPSYTDHDATINLYQALASNFDQRIFLLPPELRLSLLETTALIDQADIFVTGDTGVMHLAVTTRKLRPGQDSRYSPRNRVKIIALFGGTNPGLHGYSKQTTMIGKGRKEQTMLIPGIFKEAYHEKQQHFFDHIAPQHLTAAIIDQLEGTLHE